MSAEMVVMVMALEKMEWGRGRDVWSGEEVQR